MGPRSVGAEPASLTRSLGEESKRATSIRGFPTCSSFPQAAAWDPPGPVCVSSDECFIAFDGLFLVVLPHLFLNADVFRLRDILRQ